MKSLDRAGPDSKFLAPSSLLPGATAPRGTHPVSVQCRQITTKNLPVVSHFRKKLTHYLKPQPVRNIFLQLVSILHYPRRRTDRAKKHRGLSQCHGAVTVGFLRAESSFHAQN